MKGMRGGSGLMAVMAAMMSGIGGKNKMPKLSKRQESIAKGEYQKQGKGIGSKNQRQRRKLERQNPHLRKRA